MKLLERVKTIFNLIHKKIKKMFKIQHTKLILNTLLIMFVIIGMASMYINLKVGSSMDGVFSTLGDVLKYVLPTGACKSLVETYLEKKARLEYIKNNIPYDN